MLKILAAVFVISGFWAIGQSRSARMHARLAALWRLLDGLGTVESEIRGFCAPLPTAFAAAGAQCSLFADAARFSETETAEDAFCRAIEAAEPAEEESKILRSFAAGLSGTEQTGQLQNIERCRTRLSALADRLEKDTARLGRLYSGTGALTGILVVILLF